MDGLTFYKLFNILNKKMANSKINRISVSDSSVYFSFFSRTATNFEFRISQTPPLFYEVKEIFGESPGALAAINSATVAGFYTFGYERFGYIELKKRKPSGKLLTYKAIVEAGGNYANFLLLDDENIILYSHSARSIDPDRNIGAGGKYFPPRQNKKYNLDNFSGAKSFNELSGFYPITAKYADEMLRDKSFSEASEFIKNSLINDENFYIDEKDKVIPFFIPEAKKAVSYEELENYFKVKSKDDQSKAKQNIKKIFTTRLEKYKRLIDKLKEELQNAYKYDDIFKEAELLKANLYKFKGAGVYILDKYSENSQETARYELKQGDNPIEICEKLYKKAAKLKNSIPLIKDRMEEANQMKISAEEQIYYLENLEENENLSEFERLLKLENDNPKKIKEKKSAKKIFYELKTKDYSIFAGRNSYSNHELVFKYANDKDIWFHAQNIPSAHVILRLEGGVKLTEDLILKAARVAAGLSKNKNESKVIIDYTYKKYVNKPKNTPVGFVTYKKFSSVTVEPYSSEKINEMFEMF